MDLQIDCICSNVSDLDAGCRAIEERTVDGRWRDDLAERGRRHVAGQRRGGNNAHDRQGVAEDSIRPWAVGNRIDYRRAIQG